MILFCVIDELLELDLSKSHVMNNFKEPLLPTGKNIMHQRRRLRYIGMQEYKTIPSLDIIVT